MELFRYDSFLEDKIFESLNESRVFYTPKFRTMLSRVKDSPISKDLIELENTEIKPDITFIDLDKDGYISFNTMVNTLRSVNAVNPNIKDVDFSLANAIWDLDKNNNDIDKRYAYGKSRNLIKIGRFITRALPGKYKDKEIEEFVNKFKATIENTSEKFQVVEGEDIEKWYGHELFSNGGTLYSSCMRNKTGIFGIYTKNPEVCRMLILTEDGKLKGRAIIWKVKSYSTANRSIIKPEFVYFLDRQYTIADSLVEKFRNYADSQGWAYKLNNDHHSYQGVKFKSEVYNMDMEVQLKKVDDLQYDYDTYPYMDTFRRYNPLSGVLCNDDEKEDHNGHYILESTTGGFEEVEEDQGVYSEWIGEYIPEDEAVYCDSIGDYVRRDDAVSIDCGNRRHRGYYPSDHDDITYDDYNDRWIHQDDAVYSDQYGCSLLADDAISVVKDIESDGTVDSDSYYLDSNDNDKYVSYRTLSGVPWFEAIKDKGGWDDHDGILKSILTKDYNDEWIPKKFKVHTYQTDRGYFIQIDAVILGLQINQEQSRITDMWTYTLELKEKNLLQEIKSKSLGMVLNSPQMRMKFADDNSFEEDYKRRSERVGDRVKQINRKQFEVNQEK